MPVIKHPKRPGEWKAYYWCRRDKKQKWVPAEIVRSWQAATLEQAEIALEDWLRKNGAAKLRAYKKAVLTSDELTDLVDSFMEECQLLSPDTTSDTLLTVKSHLTTYIPEYFVRVHGQKDVRLWWQHTSGFVRWLRKSYPHLSVSTVKKIIQNLRRFGTFLVEEGVISQPWHVKKVRRTRDERETTPLPREIQPDEVLALARQLDTPMALAVLLGYFMSLRPQEVYALAKEDFMTGEQAKSSAKTYQRFAKLGLGSGLSANVQRARTRHGLDQPLKTEASYGVVNCWSPEGARAIAAHLKDLPPGYIYGDTDRYTLDKMYLDQVRPKLKIVMYDLRRASSLYLGRALGVDPFLLQDHLRHTNIETTLRYTRWPGPSGRKQNFDDVG